jgi:hypothetical protein
VPATPTQQARRLFNAAGPRIFKHALTALSVAGLLTLPAPAATLPASISGVTSQGFKINK